MRNLQKQVEHQLSAFADPTSRWVSSIGLAAAVGVAYFLAARLSLALLSKPDGVAVFWPAAGVAAGILIALGSGARLPVAIGAMAATIVANLLGDRTIWSAIVFAFCNAGEAVLTAALIEFVLRFVVQPWPATPCARTAYGDDLRDRRIGNRRNGGLCVVPQFRRVPTDDLASLVHVRRAWNHHGCAAADRTRRRGAKSAAAAGIRRRQCGAFDPHRDERAYHFPAARTLGDRRFHCDAVSVTAVACGTLPAGFLRCGLVHCRLYNCLDDDVRHRHFR